MKRNALMFCILCLVVYGQEATAQKRKILLIGTAHSFEGNIKQDFETVQDNIESFKPQLFCVEAIPVWDSISIKNVNKKSLNELDKIKQVRALTNSMIVDSLNFYSAIKHPETVVYLKLAAYSYLNKDITGNSGYYWFAAQASGNVSLISTDTLAARWVKEEKFSEYYNVIFPIALKLKMKQVYGVDDRTDSPADVIAQGKTQAIIMSGAHGPELTKIFTKLYQDYSRYEKEGNLFTILNDSTYQEQISHLLTHAYPDLSTDISAKTVKELWEKRNLSIASRIVAVLQKNKSAKRIVVSFGAAHIPLLKQYLQQLCKECEIITYQEFLKK